MSREKFTISWVTEPADTIYLMFHENTLSSTIACRLHNEKTGYTERFSLKNELEAWKWLKKFNEIGGRAVKIETFGSGGVEVQDFKDSPAYRCRFKDLN